MDDRDFGPGNTLQRDTMNVGSTRAIDGDHQHSISTRDPALNESGVEAAAAVDVNVNDASIHTPDRDKIVAFSAGIPKRGINEEFSRDRHDNDGDDDDNKGYGGGGSNKDDTKRIRLQNCNDNDAQQGQQHQQQHQQQQQKSSLSAVSGITTVHERNNANRSTPDTDTSSCVISNDNVSSPNSTISNSNVKNNNDNPPSTPSSSSSLRATTINTMPLTDIYGRIPGKEPSHTIPCPNDNCSRHLSSSRLASHLEKCLGLVSTSRRGSGGSVKLSSTAGAAAATATAMKKAAKTVGGSKKMVKPGKQTRRRSSKVT